GRDRDHARNRDVGERETRVVDGQEEALAAWREAGGEDANELRCEPNADDRDGAEAEHHRTEHGLAEQPRAVGATLGKDAQPHRHERRVERSFCQQSAKQVWDLQRREVGVRQGAGAEHRRDQHVTEEAKHSRQQGCAADRGDIARQRHVQPPRALYQIDARDSALWCCNCAGKPAGYSARAFPARLEFPCPQPVSMFSASAMRSSTCWRRRKTISWSGRACAKAGCSLSTRSARTRSTTRWAPRSRSRAVRPPTRPSAWQVSARARPSSARSRTTSSAGSSPTTSAPPASGSRLRPLPTVPRQRAAISWLRLMASAP